MSNRLTFSWPFAMLLLAACAGCASAPPRETPQAAATEKQPAERQALPTFSYRPGS